MKRIVFLLFLFAAFVVAGCQQRMVTQPESTQGAGQEDDATRRAQAGIPEEKVSSVGSEDVSRKYIEEKEGMFEDVLFDYDQYDIKAEYRQTLKSVASWMQSNGAALLSVEGHCDDRGTNEYNLALGDRRAKAVKDYLISLGVPSSRIEIISYGEERPVCSDQTESCWARNRRAHFVILEKGRRS